MKKIFWLLILLLPIQLLGQTLDEKQIAEKWKEVEALLEIRNYEQTLPHLSIIKSYAKKENKAVDWVRAVLVENKLKTVNKTSEEAFTAIRQQFERAISQSNTIEKNILNNYYAMFLWSHSNSYATKSKDDFIAAPGIKKQQIIDSLFKASIHPKENLLNQKSDDWINLFSEVKNLTLTPTIYHFLSYQYLDFLKQTSKKDDYDKLYQTILSINKQHKFADATSYLMTNDLDMYYYNRTDWLTKVENILKSNPSDYNAYLLYMIANSYEVDDKSKAITYINTAKATYPKSPWIDNIIGLEKKIRQAELHIEHQQFEPSNTYIPIKLKTRNADSLYIRVYKSTNTPTEYKNWKVNYDSLSYLIKIDAPLVYEEQKVLKSFDDFENHSTIYKLNPLPYGNYTIFVSNNSEFKNDGEEKTATSSDLIVSDVFISASLDKETDDYDFYKVLLINRKTGAPYANKQVKLYKTLNNTLELITNLKTDKNGEFIYKSSSTPKYYNLNDFEIYIPEENQIIDLMGLNEVPEHLDEGNDFNGNISFQTMMDRAIYRPGQTVHFKSILYNNHTTKGRVLTNQNVDIFLLDANYQKIDSLQLTTNEFGSVNGKFKIPTQTLAGTFRLELKTRNNEVASHYFRVEEYKRPTFKIEFETNKETYTHKDTAIFIGKVESLAGAILSDASVRYKVNYYNYNNYKNITYVDSVIQTDNQGKFYIKVPLSDTLFVKQDYFNLHYSAEVTNQSGEMQQSLGSYSFTTKPWNISINTNRNVEEGKWSSMQILTTNQNGQTLKFSGKVNIYKKESLSKPINDKYIKYFKQANYHLLDNQEYEKYFPNYFDSQTIKEDVKQLIASYNFDTNDTSLVKIDSNLFIKGYYEIEALSIQGKDTIKNSAFTSVYDPKTRKVANKDFLTYYFDKKSYSSGDKINLTFYTDVDDPANLFLFETLRTRKQNTKVFDWKDGTITYSFILTDQMISPALQITALFIKNNQAQTLTNIRVPIIDKSKIIDIKTSTFRDKITPGQKEKWTFKLNNKESKLSAEVLATMYDSSLDVFANNSFPSNFHMYQDYAGLYFYYLLDEFNQQSYSYSLFNKTFTSDLDNSLSIPRTYNLWSAEDTQFLRNQFSNDRKTSQKVVTLGDQVDVAGYASGTTRGVESVVDEVVVVRGFSSLNSDLPLYVVDGEIVDAATFNALTEDQIFEINVLKDAAATALYGSHAANGLILITTKAGKQKEEQLNNVQARTNLQETAFFYPTLYTDANGNVSFEFDSPEALTKWKLLLFAHSKTLEAGSATYFTQTQKQLMVRPNLPRYLREGDKITLKAQIQNLSKEVQKGDAQIVFINPETNEDMTSSFSVDKNTQAFEAEASKNTIVEWTITVPKDYPTVHIKIVAANADFSDGEMQELAILPNRMLISDTEKIILKPNQSQEYNIKSAQKDNLQARIQVQSNPILEIISALDYLKNYPYECNEQIVSKWFGLKMVEYIGKNYPAIATYFKTLNTEEASGKLEENASLNELKLEEMPWLRDIKNEENKLKSIAKLFNSGFQKEISSLEQKIKKNQLQSGGFAWFDGGKENFYISTRMLEVLGKVLKLDHGLINTNMRSVAQQLSNYLDNEMVTIYKPENQSYQSLGYLYARHYWNVYFPVDKLKVEKLQETLAESSLITARQSAGIAAKSWVINQLYGNAKASNEIKNRITQEAITDIEKGMYWESNSTNYNATSLQSYMVEAYKFHDPSKLNEITQWLYYNKQSNHWQTTWMTVDAIYALLLANNPQDFAMENTVQVLVDLQSAAQNKTVLGQFTKVLEKEELNQNRQVKIQNNNERNIYGNIVHQYFVELQDVKKSVQDISIKKQYLVERNGEWIATTEAKLGERIKVRITVINDNTLQYVHLKDARPSGVEPVFEPSGYKWRQGYYYTIKDASTNYFFDNLGKGKREYEYEVKANNVGVFNSGVTTIECMYEPSVNARSENTVLTITN